MGTGSKIRNCRRRAVRDPKRRKGREGIIVYKEKTKEKTGRRKGKRRRCRKNKQKTRVRVT